MMFFRSELTMLLIFSAAAWMIAGAVLKKGNVLSFLGGMSCAAGVVSGLIAGAQLEETLVYVLLILLVSCAGSRTGRREKR